MKNINEIGKIDINDKVFAKVLSEAFLNADKKIYLASKNGKIIAEKDKKININEIASNTFTYESNNELVFHFFVITEFGYSISEITKPMLENIFNTLKVLFPEDKITLRMRIVGVKSKVIAKRDIEIVKEDESN